MYTAIILAAGKAKRFNLPENKIKYMINNKPIYQYSLDKFLKLGFKVVFVVNKIDYQEFKTYENIEVVVGGSSRSESVENGLSKVNTKYVLIHDAARPFVSEKLILGVKDLLKKYDAVLPVKAITSTIYRTDLSIVDRKKLMEAETPQAFLTSKIKKAYMLKKEEDYTDDISLYINYFDSNIGLFFHETNNEKITTQEDIKKYIMPKYKIGHAYDIHQIDKNRKLFLGGIEIKCGFGLLGHSDADVLLHAIAEAIIGALGEGDLGTHFPDDDIAYKDFDSKKILKFCVNKLQEKGFLIENIDASVYAEEPKLNKYIPKMKAVIAKILVINQDRLNIKAGTNEKLDAVGQKKAIAAEAICLLKKENV